METFNSKLKKEICFQKVKEHDLALSKLSGLIKAIGEMQKRDNELTLVLITETIEIFDAVEDLLKLLYNISPELTISNDVGYNDKPKYEISFPKNLMRQIMFDTEVAYLDDDNYLCFNNNISKYVVESKEQVVEYIKGAYLGCGTSSIVLYGEDSLPAKSTGYHLEFVFSNEVFADDFMELLSSLGLLAKKVSRREFFVIYLQDFEQIAELVGLMGAHKSFLELQNENAFRSVKNNVNRQNNCYSGNITKVVNASQNQLSAIKVIQETVGIESLDLELQTACYLRLANPEESLDNLVKLSTDGITKSGLYHRFQKIQKLAIELKK